MSIALSLAVSFLSGQYGMPYLGSGVEGTPVVESNELSSYQKRILKLAPKYVGTPYVWGGTSLKKGIDSSHFVQELMKEAGFKKVPSAPVINQETKGKVVHVKQELTTIWRGMKSYPVGNSLSTNLSALEVGDRIIHQSKPGTALSGSRHTGIYLGIYKFRGKTYRHAVLHSSGKKGVGIDELTGYLWKNYRYSVRDEVRSSSGAVAIKVGDTITLENGTTIIVTETTFLPDGTRFATADGHEGSVVKAWQESKTSLGVVKFPFELSARQEQFVEVAFNVVSKRPSMNTMWSSDIDERAGLTPWTKLGALPVSQLKLGDFVRFKNPNVFGYYLGEIMFKGKVIQNAAILQSTKGPMIRTIMKNDVITQAARSAAMR